MAKPNIAVPGEKYELGMLNTPTDDFGWAFIEDELTRLVSNAVIRFEAEEIYHIRIAQGLAVYVAQGLQGGVPSRGKYLGYDGYLQDEPVNQWAAGRPWMVAVGLFASHIAEFHDHYHLLRQPGTFDSGHDFTHSDESNLRNRVTLWWGRALAGEVYRRLREWIDLDPHVTAATPDDRNWKLRQADIEALLMTICDNCLGFNILRRFHKRCDPLAWQAAMTNGLLAVPNFDEDLWIPRGIVANFSTLNRSSRSDKWDDLMEWWGRGKDWYDENVTADVSHQLSES